MDNAMIDPI